MTKYYLDFGDVYGPRGEGTTPIGNAEVDPTDLSTASALWSALPPDLRLALAKTCPKVAGKWRFSEYPCLVDTFGEVPSWERGHLGHQAWLALVGDVYATSVQGKSVGSFKTLASAQAACDAALLAQGYVLDGDTP